MVVPSIWWETGPLVVLEAFQHGRPVICSDIGGMAEKVTDGVNGLHFRTRDAERPRGGDAARRRDAGPVGASCRPASPSRATRMDASHVATLSRHLPSALLAERGRAERRGRRRRWRSG